MNESAQELTYEELLQRSIEHLDLQITKTLADLDELAKRTDEKFDATQKRLDALPAPRSVYDNDAWDDDVIA